MRGRNLCPDCRRERRAAPCPYCGSPNPSRSGLTAEEVRQIRYLHQYTAILQQTLAVHYHTSTSMISRIVSGMAHLDVEDEPQDMEAIEAMVRQYVDWRPERVA